MSNQPPADRLHVAYSRAQAGRMTSSLRPWLPLTLAYRDRLLPVRGLLDTGADVNVLPYEIGLRLGARWEDQVVVPSLAGNLGRFEARALIVSAKVGHLPPRQLGFAWTRASDVPLILGQMNFFYRYDVCFFRAREVFEIVLRQEE